MTRWAVAALVMASCAKPEDTVYPPPRYAPVPEAADIVDSCAFHCARLRFLRCPESFTGFAGTTCIATCVEIAARRDLPFACWNHAEGIEEMRACGQIACER